MKPLSLAVLAASFGMSPRDLCGLVAPQLLEANGEPKPDVMLFGLNAAVGAPGVNPFYPGRVGAPHVNPRYVGAPAVAQASSMAPVTYSDNAYAVGDVTWMGLGATTIVAASQGTKVTVKPPRPQTPQQIYCPSTVQGLLILSIAIQGTNIFNGEDGVPIELLSEVSQVPQLLYPTIDPSSGIVFTVANPTGGDLTFSGAIYGTQVRN